MPRDAHGRPKNHSKQPEKNYYQRDWVRDEFNQPTSSAPKNGDRPQTDQQPKLTAQNSCEIPSVLALLRRFWLSRHACEHIESLSVMQSSEGYENFQSPIIQEIQFLRNAAHLPQSPKVIPSQRRSQ